MSGPQAVANMEATDEPDTCVSRATGHAVLADSEASAANVVRLAERVA
jgi:hypothetical protein